MQRHADDAIHRSDRIRARSRAVLKAAGILGVARNVRRALGGWVRLLRYPEHRRHAREDQRRFEAFKDRYGSAVENFLRTARGAQPKALLVGKLFRHMETQLALLKAVQLAGFRPTVLSSPRQAAVRDCLRWAGVEEFCDWDGSAASLDFSATAQRVVAGCHSLDQLLAFEHGGSRCGRIAACTALRQLRAGALDLDSPRVRQVLGERLAAAMVYATAAQRLLRNIRPRIVLTSDVDYTPGGELFDSCMDQGIDVVTYHAGHKDNTLILKRYSMRNRDQNPASLSGKSWKWIRNIEWTEAKRDELRDELQGAYASGNWYGVAGTQLRTRVLDAESVRARLGIARDRKTAFIFPHIPWDAYLRWGQDLFESHEQWLAETLRVARSNKQVHWIIKIHPANVPKHSGRSQGETAEMAAIRHFLGQLPPHISVIPADSDIGTYSLFGIMDYCVTVRGTVGIEAASFGIPVVTAGTGRYEGRGFTIDPGTRQEYLDTVSRIHELPRLSAEKQELAERFAYGLFLLRPLPLRAISLEFGEKAGAEGGYTTARINVDSRSGWENAPDVRALAQWLRTAQNADFLREGLSS